MKPGGLDDAEPLPNDLISGLEEKTAVDVSDNENDDENISKFSYQSSLSSNAIEDKNDDDDQNSTPIVTGRRCTKNLVALSLGFVLVFSAFRALQNITSSLHGTRTGSAVLACIHGVALVTGLLAPAVVDRIGPRWAVVVGAVGYPVWIAANLCVAGGCGSTFVGGWWSVTLGTITLVVASMLVGVGQSVAWSSQVRTTEARWNNSGFTCSEKVDLGQRGLFKLLKYRSLGYTRCTGGK